MYQGQKALIDNLCHARINILFCNQSYHLVNFAMHILGQNIFAIWVNFAEDMIFAEHILGQSLPEQIKILKAQNGECCLGIFV